MARPRTFDERDVVTAARDQFWAAGYAGTSVEDLTEATGLGRGSLYGAFGDKHHLYLRALDDYCAETLASVAADLTDPTVPAYARLVAHVGEVGGATAEDAARGCLLAKSAAELGSTDEDVARRVSDTMETYQRLLADTVAQAQRDGDLDAGTDPDRLALLVLTFIRGAEALGKSGYGPALRQSAAEQFVALLPRPR
ncbi:TetR/AcrR family transcriptional regulator [Mycolicibacterium sp. P1-18]|uniref:TetR/AcrR family transcriptional regulator n=1 Tax=Mycolicibacterium sp. P1-18 TaxID=2024615 RepID=UPI0011F1C928|nr:TetR/AcrR family transcriptional regulator [Mycolicibacterium sp. P1-18]KAA0100821.1 TetR/AcrR family transcriptional regulator [Mycolicibacterium sp. P1-18]